jgi:cystathionine beta-synthase
MKKLNDSFLDSVGNTPLVPLKRLFANDKGIEVFAKVEYYNPSGSIKDRIVHYIIADALEHGVLKPGGTIVEATSGNTGAALAMLGARMGFKVILTTKHKTSKEKQEVLRMFGAELVLCPNEPAHGDPEHYVMVAARLAKETGGFLVNQYDNPLNVDAHYTTTGPEIWAQMQGKIDWFVTGGSTGGTISGIMKYLHEQDKSIKAFLADPVGSVYYGYHKNGCVNEADIGVYQTEGVGEDHLTKCMNFDVVNDAVQYTDQDAFGMVRALAKQEGLFIGPSAGGNLYAVRQLVNRLEKPTRIVTVLQDHGAKYTSKYLSAGF